MSTLSPARQRFVGLSVLVSGLALTGTSAWLTLDAERTAERQRFQRRVDEVISTIRTRMFNHEQLLRAAAGLWATDPQLGRQQWRAFVEQLNLQDSYPGLEGLGYVVHLRPEDVPPHEATLRTEGFADYQLRPPGSRDAYTAIVYLEPFSGRSLRAFGYDMFSEPVRRQAMAAARDTGLPALSGKVTLVQETGSSPQAGTLLYHAIYRSGVPTQTVDQRRTALQGYVYSPFRMGDLLQAVLGDRAEDVALELFDGMAPDPQALLYARRASLGHSIPDWQPRHTARETLTLSQHAWNLRLSSLPAFELSAGPSRAWIIALGGSLASGLAAALVLALLGTRQRAVALAGHMVQAQAQRETIVRHAPLCIIATDPQGLITSINPAGEKLLGYRQDELAGQHTPLLIHDPSEVAARAEELGIEPGFEVFVAQARAGQSEEREWTYLRRNGSRLTVSLSVAAIRGADSEIIGFLGIALDITERRRSHQVLEMLALHDALTGLPNRQLMSDRATRGIERARRHGRHFAVLLLDLDRFKQINDTLGHAVGDEVLQAVAEALRACVRATDTPARLGGDEFVVLLDDLAHPDQALQVADKILARLGQGVTAGGRHLAVTPSIGIALWPEHGASLEALLEAADAAMYRAKQAGRNAYRLAEPVSP